MIGSPGSRIPRGKRGTAPCGIADGVSAATSAASVTPGAITTISGSLLVALVYDFTNNIGSNPVSDSKGNSWLPAITSQGVSQGWMAIYFAPNIVGGTNHTVTFTPTVSSFCSINVFHVTNAIKDASVLGSTNFSTVSSTTHASGNITSRGRGIFIGGCSTSRGDEGQPAITDTSGRWFHLFSLSGATFEGYAAGFCAIDEAGITDQLSVTFNTTWNETAMIAEFLAA